MDISGFHDFHVPALQAHEARHSIIIAMLAHANESQTQDLLTWSLGGPGCCAIKAPGRGVVLGDLSQSQCFRLAEDIVELDFPAVLGPDLTAKWFVERSVELGLVYGDPMPQRIYALSAPPVYPNAPGHARAVSAGDGALLVDWVSAFHHEVVPHDAVPPRTTIEHWANEGRFLFWTVEGEPVSMAGIPRRTPNAAAIAPVYTPPDQRRRGYAGCITAATVDRIHAERRKTACLYTDLRNPFSNRCFTKIGFTPVCDSWFFPRQY